MGAAARIGPPLPTHEHSGGGNRVVFEMPLGPEGIYRRKWGMGHNISHTFDALSRLDYATR
jgi:hypothetical protein